MQKVCSATSVRDQGKQHFLARSECHNGIGSPGNCKKLIEKEKIQLIYTLTEESSIIGGGDAIFQFESSIIEF